MTVHRLTPSAPASPRRPRLPVAEVELAGWGNYPRARCQVVQPAWTSDVANELRDEGTLARGMGRSYGDAAINARGVVLDCTALNRFLAFDSATGVLTCEAGVTLAEIIEAFAPRGWFPAITPGTKLVTVGGCIANDVHGKAHHADGCFSRCVESFTILLADGRVLKASREENEDLFWANFGGMGLLGVILSATIKLRRISTTYFKQQAIRAKNLDELLEAIDSTAHTHPYAVAWVDATATGKHLGKGVLTVGDHAEVSDLSPAEQADPLKLSPSEPRLALPVHMPDQALNALTLRMLNAVIDEVQGRGAPLAHYEGFFYPLDAIGLWNRGYGRRGFTQYQFVVPLEGGHQTVRELLEIISRSRFLPFLNVLKRLGPEEGLISFPFEGYTFAIDFPIQPGLEGFLQQLDEKVAAAGGRIYLGKDAFVKPETLARMYPRLDEWRAIKAKYDPEGMFTSDLGRRVGLVEG